MTDFLNKHRLKILLALLLLGGYAWASHARTGSWFNTNPLAVWHGNSGEVLTDSNDDPITFDTPAPAAGDEVTGNIVEFGTLGVRRFSVNESNPSTYEFGGELWGLWRVNALDPANGTNLGYYLCQVPNGQPAKCLDRRYPSTTAQIAAIGQPSVQLTAPAAPARAKAKSPQQDEPEEAAAEPTPAPEAEADEDGTADAGSAEITMPTGVTIGGDDAKVASWLGDHDPTGLAPGDYEVVDCSADGASDDCEGLSGLQLFPVGS